MNKRFKYKGYEILPFTYEQRKGVSCKWFYMVCNQEFNSVQDAKAFIDKIKQ